MTDYVTNVVRISDGSSLLVYRLPLRQAYLRKLLTPVSRPGLTMSRDRGQNMIDVLRLFHLAKTRDQANLVYSSRFLFLDVYRYFFFSETAAAFPFTYSEGTLCRLHSLLRIMPPPQA